MALFWRKVTPEEALAAVRLELGGLRDSDPLPAEFAEMTRLIANRARQIGGGDPFGAQELVDGIPEGAGVLDSRGRLSVANAALDELFGEGRCLGRTLLEITRSGELAEASAAALDGTQIRGEFTVAALQKLLLVTLSPLSGRRALVIFSDLTEYPLVIVVAAPGLARFMVVLRPVIRAWFGALNISARN